MGLVSDDIKDMLTSDSSLGLSASDVFVGREPTTPKNCVTIYDTPGRSPQMTLDANNEFYQYPSIQIRVRNTKYVMGYSLGESILKSLHGRAQETWNDSLYSSIMAASDVSLLDWDTQSRPRFIINFNIQRR